MEFVTLYKETGIIVIVSTIEKDNSFAIQGRIAIEISVINIKIIEEIQIEQPTNSLKSSISSLSK